MTEAMTPVEVMALAYCKQGARDGIHIDLGYCDERMQAALKALKEAGYAIVPVVPTEAMIDRFVSRALSVSVHGDGGWSNYAREQYKAMIEAGQL